MGLFSIVLAAGGGLVVNWASEIGSAAAGICGCVGVAVLAVLGAMAVYRASLKEAMVCAAVAGLYFGVLCLVAARLLGYELGAGM